MDASTSTSTEAVVEEPLNGRRALRAELQKTWKWLRPEPNNKAREAKMGPRAVRRAAAKRRGLEFRPVIGHAIPAPDHKSYIAAMKVGDRKRKAGWIAEQKK